MQAGPLTHPSADTLRAFGHGKLADTAVADTVVQHLETCADCCAQVAALSGDSFLERLRDAHGSPDIAAPPNGTPAQQTSARPAFIPDPRAELATLPQYEVLRELGRGGMGVVYQARHVALKRLVALKMIRGGAHASHQTLRRFRTEAEAAARLQHPNIVQIYEVGEHQGRPYFSLEFVDGDNLHQKVAGKPWLAQPSARLMETLARATHFAHQKGVIHRDLKSANVLLTKDNVPKITDFGLAKQLDDEAGQTQTGQIMGTPEYMAPEQAAGKTDEIGPLTDVYGLGAILYELLTSQPPFRAATPIDTLMLVKSEEPQPPRKLNGKVSRDLETICLKCLQKEPYKRYSSAEALADDLRRFQGGEPIQARPPSARERLWKWARRHPAWAALAGGGVGMLLIILVSLFFVNAEKNHTELARQGEESQRIEAQAQEAVTRAALGFVESQVFAAARPKDQEGGMGYDVKLVDALKASLRFVETSFKDKPLVEARLRLTLGNSFGYLGDAKTAAEQYQAAWTLYANHRGPDHPNTLDSMNNLAASYYALGRYAAALELNQETLARRKDTLGPDAPDTLGSMNNLADCYYAHGRHAEALEFYEETLARRKDTLGRDHPDTLASMNNLANCYAALGRKVDAFNRREETLERRKKSLGPDHPDTLASMNNLAASYTEFGRHADALELNKETLARRKKRLGPDHPDTLLSMNNLTVSHSELGQHTEAVKLGKEMLSLMQATHGPDHPHTLLGMGNFAESLIKIDRGAEAVPIIDECLKRAAGIVVHPQLIPMVMDLRLRHFEKGNDAAGCRATAEMWEKLTRTDADSLHTAGSMRAVTAGVIRGSVKSEAAAKEAAAEADRAMMWLQRAIAAGYNNVIHMKQDKDLDTLRDRQDFRKLLAELEAKINNAAR